MQHAIKGGPSAARHSNRARRVELGIAALAFELRQAGIAERGLGFALRTLGADVVLEELRSSERFGRRARRRAALGLDRDERAAWTILAASGPRAIERRLERDGLVRRRLRRPGRTRSGARPLPGRPYHLDQAALTGMDDPRVPGGGRPPREHVPRWSVPSTTVLSRRPSADDSCTVRPVP
jgi:hypothetical protein